MYSWSRPRIAPTVRRRPRIADLRRGSGPRVGSRTEDRVGSLPDVTHPAPDRMC